MAKKQSWWRSPLQGWRVMTPQVSSTSCWRGICCPAESRNTDIDNVTQTFSSPWSGIQLWLWPSFWRKVKWRWRRVWLTSCWWPLSSAPKVLWPCTGSTELVITWMSLSENGMKEFLSRVIKLVVGRKISTRAFHEEQPEKPQNSSRTWINSALTYFTTLLDTTCDSAFSEFPHQHSEDSICQKHLFSTSKVSWPLL